jgi:mono/diheme cytochrome c family protein
MRRRMIPHVAAACVLVVGVTCATASQRSGDSGPSETIESGRDTYLFHCAACHGRAARGDGPVVPALKIVPPDLTTIAKRRGGRFDDADVTAFIVGRRRAAHGTNEMPVWGPLFRELNPYDSRFDVRLSRLVDYLKSIQVK